MIKSVKLTAFAVAAMALSGCVVENGGSSGSSSSAAPASPSVAEQACLRDVARSINNPDVSLLSSSYSEAGTEVIVGVGPQRARWRCIAYRDGSTGGIMSLTNEGAL